LSIPGYSALLRLSSRRFDGRANRTHRYPVQLFSGLAQLVVGHHQSFAGFAPAARGAWCVLISQPSFMHFLGYYFKVRQFGYIEELCQWFASDYLLMGRSTKLTPSAEFHISSSAT
jgi:hypothetical protein